MELGFLMFGRPEGRPPPNSSSLKIQQHPIPGLRRISEVHPDPDEDPQDNGLRHPEPAGTLSLGLAQPCFVPSRQLDLSFLICQAKGLPWMISRVPSGSVSL